MFLNQEEHKHIEALLSEQTSKIVAASDRLLFPVRQRIIVAEDNLRNQLREWFEPDSRE